MPLLTLSFVHTHHEEDKYEITYDVYDTKKLPYIDPLLRIIGSILE